MNINELNEAISRIVPMIGQNIHGAIPVKDWEKAELSVHIGDETASFDGVYTADGEENYLDLRKIDFEIALAVAELQQKMAPEDGSIPWNVATFTLTSEGEMNMSFAMEEEDDYEDDDEDDEEDDEEEDEEREDENAEMKDSYPYEGELSASFASAIEDEIEHTLAVFRIDAEDGKEVAAAINHYVDLILETDSFPPAYSDIRDVAVGLGILYGHAICSYYGWTWKMLGSSPEESWVSVVSPNEYYCLQPMNYMLKILEKENIGFDGNNDNTVLLLFNMLKDIEKNQPAEKHYTLS